MILDAATNIHHRAGFDLTKAPHTLLSGMSYGVPIVSIWEKMDSVIMTPYVRYRTPFLWLQLITWSSSPSRPTTVICQSRMPSIGIVSVVLSMWVIEAWAVPTPASEYRARRGDREHRLSDTSRCGRQGVKGQRPWLRRKKHVSYCLCSNMASDWLAAVLPANQKPGLKILVK